MNKTKMKPKPRNVADYNKTHPLNECLNWRVIDPLMIVGGSLTYASCALKPKPPDSGKIIDWSQYLDEAVGRVEPRKVHHGYATVGQYLAECRRDTVHRPTEIDAIISMIVEYTYTRNSLRPFVSEGTDGYKTCTDCGRQRSTAFFYANRSMKDGHDPICQDCRKERSMEAYRKQRRKRAA